MSEPKAAPQERGAARSIAVDARALHSSGLGRYLREILAEMLVDPRFSSILLLGSPQEVTGFAAEHGASGRVRVHPYPGEFYSPRTQAAWLALRLRGLARADVAFFPHYDAPLVGMLPRSVVTVHDLIHFQVPELFAAWRRAAGSLLLRRAVSGATRVITVSEATGRDLVRRLPEAAGKLTVVPNGVSDQFRAAEAGVLSEPEIEALRPFLLCVGNRKPHKNLVAAVETLALLRREDPALRLVVVGRSYPGWEEVLRRAEELEVRNALVELGEVPDDRLRGLYRSCEALLFPSLYEGFGLPVLEAMAAGAPVVASDRSSLPEVVGNAGILVAPHDHAGMAEAVRGIRSRPEWRAELIVRGRERARDYSWRRAARATLDVLYEVAGAGSRVERKR